MTPPVQQPLRQLGSNGPEIPIVGFGLMGLSVGYGDVASDEERLKVLDRAWEIGCTHWDTADSYADSEDLIGKWFKLHPERRGDIFLATKFALKVMEDVSEQEVFNLGRDSSPEYCKASLESSLKRLGVDYIDLYYIHRVDIKTPIEKTMEVLKQLKEEGKIKHIGISEISSNTLRRAHAIHPVAAVQVEYSPWNLEIEGDAGTNLMKTCEELGVAIIAYSPLGRGMLTGRYRSLDDFDQSDMRRLYDRFQPENFAKNIELADRFKGLAEKKGCTPSQLVLAWLAKQSDGSRVFVIPGTKSVKYLEENVRAAHVELTSEEEAELRALASASVPGGGRQRFFGQYVESVPLEG